jgi:two-component system sensor histidine kinase MtrB
VVGAPLFPATGPDYELYYVFPLTSQQVSLRLVRDRLLAGGAVLVVLLALVAATVARQVVQPVRQASRSAQRLASGLLTERMPVHGEDDLARLASSFNEMAAALQDQIGRLEQLSSAQRRFTADVSHELRTPLTTVRMAADLLHRERDGFPPDVARAAELLQGELDRFEALLADLLEISRHDAHAADLEAEDIDLAALVRDVADTVHPVADGFGAPLDLTGVPTEPVVVQADPRRVARIVRNLLVNAAEHGAGAPVEIAVAAGPEVVAVRVRDHGVGLATQDRERVFERFGRADPARARRADARRSGGTGLGLAIAQEDARLHGGRLDAWGRPGEGASFRLLLPRRIGGPLDPAPLPVKPADTSAAIGSPA